MTPGQRETFNRTQALMSLLEGYSNHVMNAAGAQILPGFTELHDRFERRGERRGALERAIMRLTGLDLKMEQYAAGERFADRGHRRARPGIPQSGVDRSGAAAVARRDPCAGPMDRAHRGGRVLSDPPAVTVLATPILGAPLSRDLVGRIEAVDGVRCAQIASDGRIHGDADESAFVDAEVLLLGSVPASVLDHVVTRSSRLRWIHSAAAGVDRVTTLGGARARTDGHERPRRLQPADRGVRGDDVAGHRPAAAAAPGAPARADVAAAARPRAVGADDRNRRIRQHRRRAEPAARAVRISHPRHAPTPRARGRRRLERRAVRARPPGRGAARAATSWWSRRR